MAGNKDDNTDSQAALFCKEVNACKEYPTILLIHGAFSSDQDWDLVEPHLPDSYHLLLPDLPGHGGSQDGITFSIELSVRLLADLIIKKALHGKAHIIGLSLGAHVAIGLASSHPEVVNAVFVSGFQAFGSPQTIAKGLWLESRVQSAVPSSLVRWLMDGTDLQPAKPSFSLCQAVAEGTCLKDDEWPSPWPARTLIVAAGKGGIVPSADRPNDARKLRDIGRQANDETKAYTHPAMRHPWSRQDPKLFAETARKWFEEGTAPDGFVEL